MNLEEPNEETQKVLNGIIGFFPEYQNIMYKLFTTSQNFSNEINEIKKIIFDKYLITYHEEVMRYILYIIDNIQKKYTSKYFLALIDFIDLIYQNSFYDIFAMKLQEMEICSPEKITEKHLVIFNLIVYVEHIKYRLYEEYENKKSTNPVINNTLIKRKSNSLLRIGVCVNLLEDYLSIMKDDENNCFFIINNYKIFKRNLEFTDKFFKEIN